MKLASHLVAILLSGALCASPALADPGGDHRRDDRHDDRRHDDRREDGRHGRHDGCPPGLAKKGRDCMPPGHARARHDDRRDDRRHDERRARVGDRFDRDGRVFILDPRRYNLEQRPDWSYYRDGNRAYRVDNDTQRIVAILNLIDAFTN